jgi:hypothetical protein
MPIDVVIVVIAIVIAFGLLGPLCRGPRWNRPTLATCLGLTGATPGGSSSPRGPTQIPDGVFSGAHLALPITTDRRLTTDRHGPFHAGEVRALARARCIAQSFSSYERAVPAGRVVQPSNYSFRQTCKCVELHMPNIEKSLDGSFECYRQ